GGVLLGGRSLRVSDEVGKQEARDQRAACRMPLGFGHGELTNRTCGIARIVPQGRSMPPLWRAGPTLRRAPLVSEIAHQEFLQRRVVGWARGEHQVPVAMRRSPDEISLLVLANDGDH